MPVNIPVKVPEEIGESMKRVDANLSEHLRRVIKANIREETARDANEKLDEIRRRSCEVSMEMIVKW